MGTTIPLALTFIVGIFMVGEFFIPHWGISKALCEFGAVVSGVTFFSVLSISSRSICPWLWVRR